MPDIHQAVLIAAPSKKVYDAITSAEGLSAWWAPGATAKPEVNSVARLPFGADYFKEMKIVELKPFELVRWNCVHGADEWVDTRLSFHLISADTKTLSNSYPEIKGQAEQLEKDKATMLTFHHDDWREYSLMFAECSYTWGQFLRSLKSFCETGNGQPWPYQHKAVQTLLKTS